MQTPYQTYLDNLAATQSLLRPRFAPGLTEDEILDVIHKNAEKLFDLHRCNDAILQEILFSKTAQTLTEAEAEPLRALADELFHYNRSADAGIAYCIHRLLYDYAVRQNDVDAIVRELYYQGITLFYLNVRDSDTQTNLFHEQVGAYFRAGAQYLDRYESLENAQTRGFIIRCLGNVKYGLRLEQIMETAEELNGVWNEYMSVFNRTMEIVTAPHYRQMNPEIPWDNFCYSMHFDRTQFLGALRKYQSDEISAAVLESAEYVYRHQEQLAALGERSVGTRTQYVYAAAQYHAGKLGLRQLLEVLFSIFEQTDAHDFSSEGIWNHLVIPEYLNYYAGHLPQQQKDIIQPRLKKLMDERLRYVFRLPANDYAGQVSHLLRITLGHASTVDERFANHVLGYILACHPPTFVHSKVVAMLAQWFCRRAAAVAPALLDGALGEAHPTESPEALERFLARAYQVGLYHDVGKCMLLSYVGQYSRRLLDEEFACIKLHPQFGCMLLENLGLADCACAARYHHRTFDDKGGYPMVAAECPARARLLVDVITVVDSLDAGTDNVGRSYAAAKTFDQLVAELRAGSGTRYAADIVALLDDAAFYEETRRFLEQSRRSAYLEAYCGKSGA